MVGGDKGGAPPILEARSQEDKDLDHNDESLRSVDLAHKTSEADFLKKDIHSEIETLIENLVSNVIIIEDSCRKRVTDSVNSEDMNTTISENVSCDPISHAETCDNTKMSDQIVDKSSSLGDPDNGVSSALRKIHSSPSFVTKLGEFSLFLSPNGK